MKLNRLRQTLIALTCFMVLMMICAMVFVPTFNNAYAEAEQTEFDEFEEKDELNDEVEPYGLFTSLSLSINGGDGKVWATVKNDVTIFPSTVRVVVMLYSSDTYTETYTEMTLISTNSIGDLDLGKTLTTEASTGGVAKYWIGRMRYKVDSKDWESRDTGVCKIGASGEFLGYA